MFKRLRILLVDDNLIAIKALGWALEAWGHEVRFAATGLEALAIAEEFRPDAAVLDLTLPDISGYEAATKLRANPVFETCLLIAQTNATQTARKLSFDAGFNHHLVKPVSPEFVCSLLAASDTAVA